MILRPQLLRFGLVCIEECSCLMINLCRVSLTFCILGLRASLCTKNGITKKGLMSQVLLRPSTDSLVLETLILSQAK